MLHSWTFENKFNYYYHRECYTTIDASYAIQQWISLFGWVCMRAHAHSHLVCGSGQPHVERSLKRLDRTQSHSSIYFVSIRNRTIIRSKRHLRTCGKGKNSKYSKLNQRLPKIFIVRKDKSSLDNQNHRKEASGNPRSELWQRDTCLKLSGQIQPYYKPLNFRRRIA